MKKILFMINSMGVGGAEKSLSSLLNLFDYQRYDVYLQMINRGGTFEKLLPPQVKILPSIPYFQFCGLPLVKQLTAGNIRFLKARLAVSEQLRKNAPVNPSTPRRFFGMVRAMRLTCFPGCTTWPLHGGRGRLRILLRRKLTLRRKSHGSMPTTRASDLTEALTGKFMGDMIIFPAFRGSCRKNSGRSFPNTPKKW